MDEKAGVKSYVEEHKVELDKIMKDIFEHWNEIGKLSNISEESNKMQVTFLISLVRIWLINSGMPRPVQRLVLQQLLKNL